ncbi:MAG TPA: hypothetical protein PKN87_09680 [Syntrophomonadaceae bacterium]|nr:hypothetical protein [Syntrophomonadaceae bacterium]HNX29660.1 hypothetical protein [Syntrophomonadaceae bacterium]HPR94263.1 hypothetical protein [Syntrophomonadaceae bacterium]
MADSLFSWSTLMTLSGAAMITFLIVLYTGRMMDTCGWWRWGTDLYAAFWAFLILIAANIANGGDYLDWRLYGLAFLNSFLVAASAGKLRDKAVVEDLRRQNGRNGLHD